MTSVSTRQSAHVFTAQCSCVCSCRRAARAAWRGPQQKPTAKSVDISVVWMCRWPPSQDAAAVWWEEALSIQTLPFNTNVTSSVHIWPSWILNRVGAPFHPHVLTHTIDLLIVKSLMLLPGGACFDFNGFRNSELKWTVPGQTLALICWFTWFFTCTHETTCHLFCKYYLTIQQVSRQRLPAQNVQRTKDN